MKRRASLASTLTVATAPLLPADERKAGKALKVAVSPYESRLRYYIGEEYDIPARSRTVAEFCHRVGIDGVMMMSAAYEHQPWILTREEYIRRAAAMGEAARILRAHGLKVEINVMVTYGHGDAGLPPAGKTFPFDTMMNFDGTAAAGIPCPLDPTSFMLPAIMASWCARSGRTSSMSTTISG